MILRETALVQIELYSSDHLPLKKLFFYRDVWGSFNNNWKQHLINNLGFIFNCLTLLVYQKIAITHKNNDS